MPRCDSAQVIQPVVIVTIFRPTVSTSCPPEHRLSGTLRGRQSGVPAELPHGRALEQRPISTVVRGRDGEIMPHAGEPRGETGEAQATDIPYPTRSQRYIEDIIPGPCLRGNITPN